MRPTTFNWKFCAVMYVPFSQSSAVCVESHFGTIGRMLSAVDRAVSCVHVKVAPLSQVVPRQISRLVLVVESLRGS